MAYTAIVLNEESQKRLREKAIEIFGPIPDGWIERMHHVTLCMGTREMFSSQIGQTRILGVEGFGLIKGEIYAFWVSGAKDSANKKPHVTIAHAEHVKPRVSNDIRFWFTFPQDERFEIEGTVEICD